MARITLEPSSILQYIPLLLHKGRTITSAPEALAVLVHAINTALELQLIGVDETSNSARADDGYLPENWNVRSPDFTLKYREPEFDEVIIIKLTKVGSKSHIHGILEQKEETSSMDVLISEFASTTYFQTQNNEDPLIHGYVSSDRVAEFTTKYIKDILRPLLPDLNYEPKESTANVLPPAEERPPRSRLLDDRENENRPPSLHQPYELPRRSENPLEVGRSDLDPIPNPFAGVQPIRPLNPGGGMYVGPGHPMFGQGRDPTPGRGPWGGDSYLPPLGAPPGARFDPIVPFGGGIGGIPGRGGAGARQPPRPFSGEPDNDEFLPPSFGGGSVGGNRGLGGNFPDNMYM